MKIVLTRPYQDSVILKNLIEKQSKHECYIAPLISIELLASKIDIPENAVIIFTSKNGARALAQNTKNRQYRVITVGKQSNEEAKKLGFVNVESAVKSASAGEINLIKYIKLKVDKKLPVIHISADVTKGGLEKSLIESGYKYNRIILYNSNQVDFTEEFINKIREGEFKAFTFFSEMAAAIFKKQIYANGLNTFIDGSVAFCLSEDLVSRLSGLNFKTIYIPEVTNTESFVKLINDYKK